MEYALAMSASIPNHTRHLTIEEERPRFIVRSYTLKQRKSIAHAIRCRGRQLGRIQEGIDGDDLLQERSHDAYRH